MPRTKRWYSPRIAANLERCYNRASEVDRTEGLTWYQSAHDTAVGYAGRFGVTTQAACGVIAALSPGRNWEANVEDAEVFLDEWAHGARGKQLPLVGSYGWRNIVKASKIASGKDPLDILGGNKVRAFYACILNPSNDSDVCIDRHAKCAAVGEYLGDTVVRNSEYHRFAKHYRRAAAHAGVLPHQFQAVVWVTWRRLSGNLAQLDLLNEVPF